MSADAASAPGCPGEGFLAAREDFLRRYPEYCATGPLDELRARDYARLDALGDVYLDYTGAALYGSSQVRRHLALLESRVFGNPHSRNPASAQMSEWVERGRRGVLEYFRASPEEYTVIFTSNATGALKLVGESYPFSPGSVYLLTFDNHNSVNGIREFARARGARIRYVPLSIPGLLIDAPALEAALAEKPEGKDCLFAYPAQSNFSGAQHDLAWVERAQAAGWDVLLDAAAFVPTNRLDLSAVRPEFVALSFYKMFGYPTGIGCLIAKRSVLGRLHRPWFAGGTITVASVQGDTYFLADGPEAFEDGTVDFLNIPGVEIGLDHLRQAGLDRIHVRVGCLARWLIGGLEALHHANGAPLVRIYGPGAGGPRGGTVTMNFYDARGRVIDHRLIEDLAARRRISLRTGCFCNPGGGEAALGLRAEQLRSCFSRPEVRAASRFTLDDLRLCIDAQSTGAVRVSFGIASNFEDAWRFLEFARSLLE
ncbi:MAG: aminotransferase class V-fold PLP-dependent enzyme [Bryobacteraceae bacterium]|nr:aminotransferase class V-fold PLP-dependent enzyme [Bryobacteraceae bacterium]MCX7604938.1 aminotransferase class V-fold PLP-dependent enzyme [Bryobacteraceae bacterium]